VRQQDPGLQEGFVVHSIYYAAEALHIVPSVPSFTVSHNERWLPSTALSTTCCSQKVQVPVMHQKESRTFSGSQVVAGCSQPSV
jgi:hypothetical protein